MIRDLSETLQVILNQPGLPRELAEAEIVFDRPVAQFTPQKTCINLFLYDIRENVELRSNESTVERESGQVIIRHPSLRVACTYLVTAWVVGGTEISLQEHQLLSQVLQVLSRYPTIPEPFLRGSLQGQEPPLPMMVTSADGLKNPAEFWTSLGTPLRASLAVMVTISMVMREPETAPLALTHELRLNGDSRFQIGGQVTNASNEPILDATVLLVERNLTATTGDEGVYEFSAIPNGSYTLQVQRSGSPPRNFPITVPAIARNGYNLRLN
jgi:hypothetical protein